MLSAGERIEILGATLILNNNLSSKGGNAFEQGPNQVLIFVAKTNAQNLPRFLHRGCSSCEDSDGARSAQFFVVPRKAGGFIIFSVANFQSTGSSAPPIL